MLKVEGRWAGKIEELLAASDAKRAVPLPRASQYKTKCRHCEKPLIERRTCDETCQAAAYAAKVAARVTVIATCSECQKPFEAIKSNRVKSLCSNSCSSKKSRRLMLGR